MDISGLYAVHTPFPAPLTILVSSLFLFSVHNCACNNDIAKVVKDVSNAAVINHINQVFSLFLHLWINEVQHLDGNTGKHRLGFYVIAITVSPDLRNG